MSSWAFWAGFLSNASEVHVNSYPLHPLLSHDHYIYHNEKQRLYFGKFNQTKYDIHYQLDLKNRSAISHRRMEMQGQGEVRRSVLSAAEEDYREYLAQLYQQPPRVFV